VSSRPKKIHLASDLMRGRTDRDLVRNAVEPLAYDEKKKCCAKHCFRNLIRANDLSDVVDAIMCERRGVLCGDQNQKTERLRNLLNKSYDAHTGEQQFIFYNHTGLEAGDDVEETEDGFKVKPRPSR
jgi:hypothetical protein